MDNKDLFKLLDGINLEDKKESTFKKHDRVLLIDGLNLFLRNFAVINHLNPQNAHIGGLSGFLKSLGSLINIIKPTSVYVVFDGIGSSVNRKNLVPEYKSNRNIQRITNFDIFESLEEENDSKVGQVSRLIHYLKCLPVKIVCLDRTEADDVIAHLSTSLAKTKKSKVFIVSNDHDYLQLVNDRVQVYIPAHKEFYDPSTVISKFGLIPNNFILYKTLLGDNSDSLGGVKGLGKKGIFKKFPELIDQPLTLDNIFEISEKKYKDHIVYSRVLFDRETLGNKYKIMDLKNPLLSDDDKVVIKELIGSSTTPLNIKDFILFYNEDGLGSSIKNLDYWLRSNFSTLNNFK